MSEPENHQRRKRGRPSKANIDPATLVMLTMPEVLAYMRQLGRGVDRPKIHDAILEGHLPAYLDDLRHDRMGRPLLIIRRVDLEAWLITKIRPMEIHPTVSRRKVS